MDRIQAALMQLLASALQQQEPSSAGLSNEELHLLCKEAKEHDLHPIILNVLKKLNLVIGNEILHKEWSKFVMFTLLYQKSMLLHIHEVLNEFEKNNIQVMLLKGFYLKTLYPLPDLRIMGDIDLFVQENDLSTAFKLLTNMGYRLGKNNHSTIHYVFTHPKYITIELHYSIVGETFNESIKAFDRTIWDEHTSRLVNNHVCIIPSDVNHAIYLCIHMLSHFNTAGFGLRQLCDLVVLVTYSTAFDWDEFFSKTKTFNILNFVKSILFICHTYLRLKVPDRYLAVINAVEKERVESLLAYILQSGVFGGKSKDQLISSALAKYKLNLKNNQYNNSLNYLFPNREQLNHFYSYAKEHAFLLPIAWLHRLFLNLGRKDIKFKDKLPNKKLIMQRIELIKWVNKE